MNNFKRFTKLSLLCFILFAFSVSCSTGNQVSSGKPREVPFKNGKRVSYDKNGNKMVEELPRFKHGDLGSWIASRVEFPTYAEQMNISGVVRVRFFVDTDGKVVEPQVVQSVHPILDREALRVVGLMPAWEPGKINGKPVKVTFTLPVRFHFPKKQNNSPL